MSFFLRNSWPTLLLLVAISAGCRGPLAKIPGNPLARDTQADYVRYGRTPAQKVDELRKLSAEINSYSAEEQQQIARTISEQLLKEDDPRMRRELTRVLGFTPTQESTSALLGSLSDPEVHVRLAACDALAKQGNPSTISALSRALEQDEDVDVRLAAANALGFFKDPQAVAALGATLEVRDPALRNRGMLALRQSADVDLGMDVAAWQNHVQTVVASLNQQDTSMAALPTDGSFPTGAPPPSEAAPAGGHQPAEYAPNQGSQWPVQPAAGEQSIYGP